jgi:hypothetical protein
MKAQVVSVKKGINSPQTVIFTHNGFEVARFTLHSDPGVVAGLLLDASETVKRYADKIRQPKDYVEGEIPRG